MSLFTLHLLPKFVLVMSISMPMGSGVHLDRTSTYTYTGIHAKSNCLKERDAALHTKVEAGDKFTVGECVRK